jgi:hypothetical protein
MKSAGADREATHAMGGRWQLGHDDFLQVWIMTHFAFSVANVAIVTALLCVLRH